MIRKCWIDALCLLTLCSIGLIYPDPAHPARAAAASSPEASTQNSVMSGKFKEVTVAEYFSCEVPTDWNVEISASGSSQQSNNKVHGLDLTKYVGSPVPLHISVYYYGKGNSLYATQVSFIASKSHPVVEQVGAYRYGEVFATDLAGRPASTFMRPYRQFVPAAEQIPDLSKPGAENDTRVYETGEVMARKIPLIERYVVVPAGGGFYAISYSTPEECFEEFLSIFNRVASSFRPTRH